MLEGSNSPSEVKGDHYSPADVKSSVKVVAGAEGCEEAVAAGAVALMVDALRASATITALTSAGAGRIFVATHVEQARRVKERIGDVLLIGEREGFPPEGFDAGNSPAEVLQLGVEGRQIAFTSTTGAARLGQLRGAAAILVGGPVNASAVVEAAASLAGDGGLPIYAIAAGLTGRPGGTEEDWLGAALLAQGLAERGYDWVNREEHLNEHWPDRLTPEQVREGFFAGAHGQSLVEKELGDDITDCSRVDWLPVVAQVVGYREIDDGPPVAELQPLL
jgi:2-phosphosulfolactate phosphatase